MQDSGLVDHCLELLAPLGRTRAGRMFSGYGLYVDDLCIAFILRETLYLKVDDAHRADFEAAGCQPFTYETRKGERQSISYYSAPGEAMESPAEMRPWARRALEAAVAARAKAAPRRKKAAAKATAGKAPAKTATQAAAAKKPPARAAAKKATPAKTAAARPRTSRA
ncbi:MAG: TfoX/Sxy family protein [Burkholderiaceae bacterium]